MNNQDFKQKLITKSVPDNLIIFQYQDNPFIAEQYIHEIARQKNLDIESIDNLSEIVTNRKSPFYIPTYTLYVYRTESVDEVDIADSDYLDHVIIIAHKVSENINGQLVRLCALEDWCVKDYLYSNLQGADTKDIDMIADLIGTNIYRAESEINRLSVFDDKERHIIVHKCIEDGIYSDLSNFTIFDLSNAFIRRDLGTINSILSKLDNIDIEPLGLVTVLYNNFKNIILVQALGPKATALNTGLKDNQFYAIKKYSCGYYSIKKLEDILLLLTNINKQLLLGNMPVEYLIDYLVINILS